jgi:hypothetical protein
VRSSFFAKFFSNNEFVVSKQFVIATTWQPVHRLPAFNAIKFLGFDDDLRTVTEGGVG